MGQDKTCTLSHGGHNLITKKMEVCCSLKRSSTPLWNLHLPVRHWFVIPHWSLITLLVKGNCSSCGVPCHGGVRHFWLPHWLLGVWVSQESMGIFCWWHCIISKQEMTRCKAVMSAPCFVAAQARDWEVHASNAVSRKKMPVSFTCPH